MLSSLQVSRKHLLPMAQKAGLGDLGAGGCRCSFFHQGALLSQLHLQAPRELRGGVQSSYSCPGLSTEVEHLC